MQYIPVIARILLAIVFLASGAAKITNFSAQVAFADGAGIPMASAAIVAAIIIELAGAAMLVLGWKARYGAAALAFYSIVTAMVFHTDFSQQTQMIQFMKNLAITGGMLYVITYGTGRYALDNSADSTPHTAPQNDTYEPAQ